MNPDAHSVRRAGAPSPRRQVFAVRRHPGASLPRRWLFAVRGRRRHPAAGLRLAVLAAIAATVGCNYSFRSGAGFPEHVRTIAVLPFDNETNRFELTQEVHEALLRQVPRSLGLNPAGEADADAVLSGRILRYELTAPLYRQTGRGQAGAGEGGIQVLQREVVLVVQVEVLDRQEYAILWESSQLLARGQFLEASETEEAGRAEAIELLVQEIVDGAQSNW